VKTGYKIGIALAVVIIVGMTYYVGYGGICTITVCETEIEVISSNLPLKVQIGEIIRGTFTVKNNGVNIAENCALHWRPQKLMMSEFVSESFSLQSTEEIIIYVESLEGAKGVSTTSTGAASTVWVVCDNTESSKIDQIIGR